MFECFLASSLEKVFPNQCPARLEGPVYAWGGTRVAVQLVYYIDTMQRSKLQQTYRVAVQGAPAAAELFSVELIASEFPCSQSAQDDLHYLTREPGLFPDLLRPLAQDRLRLIPCQYRSLWISIPLEENAAPGVYHVTVRLVPETNIDLGNGCAFVPDEEMNRVIELSFRLYIGAALPMPRTLIHTEWFHADCLADYYHVPIFSEEHWRILENFIKEAVQRHQVNMLLTPIFTPPLDTAVGEERPTVQLVDIIDEQGQYHFGFERLHRWLLLCKRCGVEYLEISHLFTQWGAQALPKIIVEENGKQVQRFGWHTPADSPEYRRLLEALLPALHQEFARAGYDQQHVYYHISDEPHREHLDNYVKAKKQTQGLLEGCPIIDALSSFEFYQQGVVERPVPANNHIQPFFEAGVPDLWVYYCCSQGNRVPNRFFAMPSARNRIMGALMYRYGIKGFLHWGYNFYYRQLSRGLVNPFVETHCGYAYASGDAYLVYPGEHGVPYSSVRAEVQTEGLEDFHLLQMLETQIGREAVLAMLNELAPQVQWTFESYPTQPTFFEALRRRIYELTQP